VEGSVNDSEHELRRDGSPCGEQPIGPDEVTAELIDAPTRAMDDLSSAATDRIHRFMADSTVRGGASPSDVADLYTSQEIVDDDHATAYLDRRFVHGELLNDWRDFQDRLSSAYLDGQPGMTGEALLDRVRIDEGRQRAPRSIFDDPDEDELLDDELTLRMEDRDPRLSDLGSDSRRAIERHIISEVLCYGVAPYKVMQLRESLRADGDERALQYLDLPFELGGRPADWDGLRDLALMVRARLEGLGVDPSSVYDQADATYPHVEASELLNLLDERDPRR
jgi:hypothetical protein